MDDGSVKIIVDADESKAKKKLEDVKDTAEETADGLEDLGDSADKSSKGLKDVEDKADKAGKKIKILGKETDLSSLAMGVLEHATGNLLSGGIEGLISGLGNAVQSLINLADETREFREDMAKLETAFKTAGHDAEAASKTYEDFYAILGESDRSVEAVNHLAELTDNTADLSKWSTIAAGVTAKFGDSLPIEGLTEAANETAKVGKVTGPLADALNWAGISEDKFNKALEKCNSEQERATLITNTLNKEYEAAATEYNTLTASAQAARRATAEIEAAQARLGAVMEPLNTIVTEVKASFFSWAADLAEGVAENLESTKERVTFLTAEQRALVEASLTAAESIAALKASADEASIGISSQFNYTKSLADELLRLADTNGVVQEADKARAEFILGELNSALGTEYTMTGNIISNYTKVKESIYGVIEAKRAQILLQQYEEQYAEAIKNLAAQENARATQAIALAEAQSKVEQAMLEEKQLRAEYEKAVMEGLTNAETIQWAQRLKVKGDAVKKEQGLLDDVQKKYDETDSAVEGSLSAINAYEQASTAILQGETDKAIKILNNYGNGFTDAATTASAANEKELESLRLKVINTSIELGKLEKDYEDNHKKLTEAQKKEAEKRLEAARKEAQDARTEFATVGGNMVEGLSKGAEDKDGNPTWNLAGKLRKIVRAALNAANEEADINSPAKETQYTGHMLMEGLALGIEGRRNKAINAMRSVGAEVIQEMHAAASAEVKEIEKRSDDIVKAYEKGDKELQKRSEDIVKTYEKRDKELQKQRNKSNAERIDAQREALKEELELQKEAIKKERELAKEKHELEKEAVKKELETAKEKQKSYENFFNVYQKYTDNMLKLEETYAANVSKVKEKLASDIEAANERYISAFEGRVASIKNELSIFEEAEKGDFVTGKTLTKALKSQIGVLEDYNKALDELASKNVSQAFIEEMKGMGIDALPELEAINRMTEKQLTEYVALWEEKNKLATEAATEELKGMRAATDAEIEGLKLKAEEELAELRQTYRDETLALITELGLNMQSAGSAGLEALGVQVTLYSSMGSNLMQGVIDGIESEKDSVIASVVNNVIAAIEAAKEAAGIHSPSTVTRDEIGKNLGLGVAEGWHNEVANIKKTMADDLSGVVARVKATVSAENARFAHSTGVPDTGFSEIARAVGLQTAGINSLAGEFRRGTGTTRPIIIELDRRELGRTVVDVGGTEEVRIGAKLSLGGAK